MPETPVTNLPRTRMDRGTAIVATLLLPLTFAAAACTAERGRVSAAEFVLLDNQSSKVFEIAGYGISNGFLTITIGLKPGTQTLNLFRLEVCRADGCGFQENLFLYPVRTPPPHTYNIVAELCPGIRYYSAVYQVPGVSGNGMLLTWVDIGPDAQTVTNWGFITNPENIPDCFVFPAIQGSDTQ